MTDAAMVRVEARPADQQADGGSRPTSPLQSLLVRPITIKVAKALLVREHYLRSLPGGTQLAFGVFLESCLLGALTMGVGPFNGHSLVEGAARGECLTLSRLWLSEELPKNSESLVIGAVLRALRKYTDLKFILSYADPVQGHVGIIYQASNWIYTGLSIAMPLYDMGDGKPHHSRSIGNTYGTHSVKYLQSHGVDIKAVPQTAKHRYLYFLDQGWQDRLRCPVLPYPKLEAVDGTH